MTTALTLTIIATVLLLVTLTAWTQARIYDRIDRTEQDRLDDHAHLTQMITDLHHELHLLTGHNPHTEPENPND